MNSVEPFANMTERCMRRLAGPMDALEVRARRGWAMRVVLGARVRSVLGFVELAAALGAAAGWCIDAAQLEV